MNIGQAIKTVLSKYGDFSGVAGRPEYWWWILFTWVVTLLINVALPGGLTTSIRPWGEQLEVTGVGGAIGLIWVLFTCLPTLAVVVRRLRDSGKSWVNLFWLLLPILGPLVFFVLMVQPGQTLYGKPPVPRLLSERLADAAKASGTKNGSPSAVPEAQPPRWDSGRAHGPSDTSSALGRLPDGWTLDAPGGLGVPKKSEDPHDQRGDQV